RGDAAQVLDRVVLEGIDGGAVFRERGDVVLDQCKVGRSVGEAADIFDGGARRTHLQAVVGVRLDDLFDLVRERVVGPAGAAGVPDEVVGAAPTAGAVPAGTVATTAPAARPVPAGAVVTAATGTARETGRADDAERAGGS